MARLRTALSNPALRRLLAAQVVADFADWLDFLAIGALLAFHWRVEPAVFALLAVAFGLPYLIVGPVAGVLVDRMDLRLALVGSNVARAAATLAMAFAGGWQGLLALVVLRGVADSFFTPSKQGALQALTTPEIRTGANAISHAINQASKIVAPSLGGALLLVMEPAGIFVVNAIASLAAAMILWRLPGLPRTAGDEAGAGAQGLLSRLSEGFAELRGKPLLRGALALMAAGYFAIFFYDTLIAPLIRDIGLTETAFGLSMAAVGAGGVLGAGVVSLAAGPKRPLIWIGCGFLVAAVLIAWLGLVEIQNRQVGLGVVCALFAIVGMASSASFVPTRTILQNEVSPDRIGRVTALGEAANALAVSTAPFLGTALASATTIGVAFVVGGALLALTGALAFFLHRRHRIR